MRHPIPSANARFVVMTRRVVFMSIVLGGLMTVTSSAFSEVPPAEERPAGDGRPIVVSAELLTPQAENALLEADLRINAVDRDGIAYYEYRWIRSEPGKIHTTSVEDPSVSYVPVLPDAQYGLEVRAVDVLGQVSEWDETWSGITPPVPVIVVAGDSIPSGYTRRWFTGRATCRDAEYSFGATIRDAVAASLPEAWAPDYVNVAFPGADMGSVLDGGSDSCSDSHTSQIDDIARYSDPATWSTVIMTAGINSTNWVDVVKGLTWDTAMSPTKSGDRRACEEAVTGHWNLDTQKDTITSTTEAIVEALDVRTNASVFWASYPSIDGSTIAPGWSPIGTECAAEMDHALGELHGAIRAGLDPRVTWVDVSDLDVSTQMWAGWPHPSRDGHRVIGLAIAEAIVG